MAPKTDPAREGRVSHPRELHYSIRRIVEMFKNSVKKLSKGAVERIVRDHRNSLAGVPKRAREIPEQSLPNMRTPDTIRKVAAMVYKKLTYPKNNCCEARNVCHVSE